MNCKDKLAKFRAFLMANSSSIPESAQDQILYLLGMLDIDEHSGPDNSQAHEVLDAIKSEEDYPLAMLRFEWLSTDWEEWPKMLERYLNEYGVDQLAEFIVKDLKWIKDKNTRLLEYTNVLRKLESPDADRLVVKAVTNPLCEASLHTRIRVIGDVERLDESELIAILNQWRPVDVKQDTASKGKPPYTKISYRQELLVHSYTWPTPRRANLLARLAFGKPPFHVPDQAPDVKVMLIDRFRLMKDPVVNALCKNLKMSPAEWKIQDPQVWEYLAHIGVEGAGFGAYVKYNTALYDVMQRSEADLMAAHPGQESRLAVLKGYVAVGTAMASSSVVETYKAGFAHLPQHLAELKAMVHNPDPQLAQLIQDAENAATIVEHTLKSKSTED